MNTINQKHSELGQHTDETASVVKPSSSIDSSLLHDSDSASAMNNLDDIDASGENNLNDEYLLKYTRFLGFFFYHLLKIGINLENSSTIIDNTDTSIDQLYDQCLQRHEIFVKLGYI